MLNTKKNLVLSVAVMGLALGSSSSAMANIVTDGNFADGANFGTNWNPSGSFLGVESGNHPDGAIQTDVYMGTVGGLGNISQSLATNAGTAYHISFDLSHPSGSQPSEFQALFGSNLLIDIAPVGSFGYTHYSFTSLSNGLSTLLHFNEREDPSYMYLTNVSVSAVPLPASVQMFGLGLLGLVGFAYYNRRKNGFVA